MRLHRSERRVRRSSNPTEALAWWLQACKNRTNLRNLALVDDLGTLVSGAGSANECDELAAWAPIVLTHGTPEGARPLSGVKLPGFEAYLCTDSAGAQGELSDVAAGCARILGRPEPHVPASPSAPR
jgi:hypothetical protein